jgi:hypothetical protein
LYEEGSQVKIASLIYFLLLASSATFGQSTSQPAAPICRELGNIDSCNTFNAMLQSQDKKLDMLTHKGSDHYVCLLPKNVFIVVSISRPKISKDWVNDMGTIEENTYTSGALTNTIDAPINWAGPSDLVTASLNTRGYVNKPLPKIVSLSINPYWVKFGTQYKFMPSASRIEELTITTATMNYTLTNEINGQQEQVSTGRCLKYGE